MDRERRPGAHEEPGRIIWLDRRAERDDPARRELAVSAYRFSHRTRALVEDKLTLSAALMRAGEVHEARRLVAEVERDVRTEEAALLERMNELKVARSLREAPQGVARYTRTKLVRMLAVAVVGSSVSLAAVGGFSLARNDTPAQVIDRSELPAEVAGASPEVGTAEEDVSAKLVPITINGKQVMVPADKVADLREALVDGTLTQKELRGIDIYEPTATPGLLDTIIEAADDPAGTVSGALDDVAGTAESTTGSGQDQSEGTSGGTTSGGSSSGGSTSSGGGSTGGGSGGGSDGGGSTGGGSDGGGSDGSTGGGGSSGGTSGGGTGTGGSTGTGIDTGGITGIAGGADGGSL